MQFVRVSFEVNLDMKNKPRIFRTYRIFLNGEMMTERKLIWDGTFCVNETLQIKAPAGIYSYELVEIDPVDSGFIVGPAIIEVGDAIANQNRITIR